MERLWTPWRMAYIKDAGRTDGCIFCDLPALDRSHDPESLILYRGTLAFVIMNKFPYNSGHLMVSPYRHTAEFESLTVEEHAEVAALLARCLEALKATHGPHGFNIGINQGTVAGAGIAGHVHGHVVPRWGGDTNFMTTVGETKVLPEVLEDTYERLAPHFR